MIILKPKKLEVGDTIGIVAQSVPVLPSHKENYLKGKKVFEDLGFNIKEGETIGKIKWWRAGEPKEIAEDINRMFADKNIKAIMAHAGGYSAISLLEYLDYELISKNPKPYMGFSDMTSIHLALFEKCGLVGFHMNDLLGRGEREGEKLELFKKFLMSNEAPGVIKSLNTRHSERSEESLANASNNVTDIRQRSFGLRPQDDKTTWESWKGGKASGHLMGGNLHIMMAQSATEYFPSLEKWEGAILFFEEVGETLHDMARCLIELKYMGILDKINGVIVGKIKYVKPNRDTEIVEPSYKEMILDCLNDFNFPILGEVDFGHYSVNIPMPIGVKVEMDADKKEIKFLEAGVIE